MADRELDLSNIQGNIIPGFKKPHQMFFFLKITNIPNCRSWLSSFKITSARDVLTAPEDERSWVNVAFSYNALKLLYGTATDFVDESFKLGLAARSAELGDPTDPKDEGHPSNWVVGGFQNEADVVLILAHDKEDTLRAAVEELERRVYETSISERRLIRSGVQVIFKQQAARLERKRENSEVSEVHEHFGFSDGNSQPRLRGLLTKDQSTSSQDILWPGEFIFGYPCQNPDDLEGKGEVANAGPFWAENGAFLVFRRLRQDVAGFRAFLCETAQRLKARGMTEDLLAATLVGRWQSGAPLMRDPMSEASNDFTFGDDAQGETCPFSSHVRKANPRDDEIKSEQGISENKKTLRQSIVQTHRLLRRGISYGIAPEDPDKPDTVDRGLLFLAYQTSIERQFEFLMKNWINNQDFKDPGVGYDPIIGQNNKPGEHRERKFTTAWQAGKRLEREEISTREDWVIPTGGGYFFAPSIKTFKDLATASRGDVMGNVSNGPILPRRAVYLPRNRPTPT